MHDRSIEERLRSTLRSEADALPLTITAEELDRRLSLRRRDRMNRRFGLLAAGVAAIAVTGVFALAVGPFRGPMVATTPQPSVLPSAVQPSTPPSSVPSSRPSAPLGAVGQAVLVRPVGEDTRRPEAFEVSLFDPIDASTEVIATMPGSILPDDGWLDGGEGAPVVSTSGYLVIPFTRGPNEDDRYDAIAIVDIRTPTADAWILDRYRLPRWGPAEDLAVDGSGEDDVRIASVASRTLVPATTAPGVAGEWTTDPELRVVKTVDSGWGYVDALGTFVQTDDLPAMYQRTGRERPAGVDGHTLGLACDSGQPGECFLIESSALGDPEGTWWRESDGTRHADHLWAADGRGVLMLLVTGNVDDRLVVQLVHAATPDARSTVATFELPGWSLPTVLGVSEERTPGKPTLTAVGDSGRVLAFVLEDGTVRTLDGTSWFAGWADDPEPYDPD